MAYSVRISDLNAMSEAESAEAARRLIPGIGASSNGQLEGLDAEIHEYELRYETDSERLIKELYEGERQETADIARWLWLIDLRQRAGSHRTG
jgi:hypothetical protein